MASIGKTVAGEHTFRDGIDRSYPDAIDRNTELAPLDWVRQLPWIFLMSDKQPNKLRYRCVLPLLRDAP